MCYSRKLSLQPNVPQPEQVAGKTVKVVFIAAFAQHQDTAHLLSRFALDARVISVTASAKNARNGAFQFGQKDTYWPELATTSDEVLAQLRNALSNKPDVIVLGALPEWKHYPLDIRESIEKQVAAGGKLFIINNELLAGELFPEAVPCGEYHGGKINATAKFSSFGNGRVVCYNVDVDERHGYFIADSRYEAGFEYSIAFFADCLFRAAGNTGDGAVEAEVSGKPSLNIKTRRGDKLDLKIRRYEDYSLVSECSFDAVDVGEYNMEDFPADEYVVELKVYDGNAKLLDRQTIFFDIDNELEIIECGLDVVSGLPGGHLKVKTRLQENYHGLKMRCRWIDGWGRVLEETAPVPFVSEYGIEIPRNSLSVVNRIEIEFLSGDRLLRIVPLEIAVPTNVRQQDFPFLVWNLTDEFSWKQKCYFDALRTEALGDAICNCAINCETARYAALSHLRTVPYSTWFHKVGLDDCLFNAEWLNETTSQAEAAAVNHRDYGPMGYTLGDECYVDAFTKGGRFSSSEHVWVKFRSYLQKVYNDSLDELNREWETAFNSWDAVKFETDSELLKSFDNPAPWTDFRMFTADTFASIFRGLRDRIRHHDPEALVGWDGCEEYSSYDGIDWWEFTRDMEINVVYAGSTLGGSSGLTNRTFNSQAVKSFNPDAPLSGAFMNSIDYNYGGEYSTWHLLLNGYKSMWWWHATYPDYECGALKWDLTTAPIVSGIKEALREIRDGADTMLTHAEKQYSPVAIHYSANNFHASTLESGVGNHINNIGITKTEFWTAQQTVGRTIKADAELVEMFGDITPSGHYAPAFKNFYMLLKDIGLQPQTMARQQIELDILSESGIKVLVLPFTVSLSDQEVDAIRRFVEAGGLLIADYRCGFRDMHGKMRGQPALDDVFGVRHKSMRAVRGNCRVSVEYNFSRGGNFDTMFRDELELTGSGCVLDSYDDGTPMVNSGASVYGCHEDGSPAFIVNHFGRGKALLLNFDLYNYDHIRREQRHIDMLEMFRYMLWKLAELKAEIIPEYRNGAPTVTVETVRLNDRENIYHGIIPDFAVFNKVPVEGFLRLADDKHIYDVRAHQYLGMGSQEVVFAPGKPLLLAELPDKITGVDITMPPDIVAGMEVAIEIFVETHAGKNIPCTVKMEVMQPDGICPEYYVETLYLENGSGVFTFTPSLNAPTGCWKLKCTEYISGLYAEAVINVKKSLHKNLLKVEV